MTCYYLDILSVLFLALGGTGIPTVSAPVCTSSMTPIEPDPARRAADAEPALTVLTEIYGSQYRSLVRMSAMLLGDVGTAEEVVQDSFIAVHTNWHGLRDTSKALHYLRSAVLNRSRSVLRRRAVADRHMPPPEPDMPSAEHAALTRLERLAVISALRALPPRQREALVLRFYLDLSEEQAAAAMNISTGALKSHTSRGKAAMRTILERER